MFNLVRFEFFQVQKLVLSSKLEYKSNKTAHVRPCSGCLRCDSLTCVRPGSLEVEVVRVFTTIG